MKIFFGIIMNLSAAKEVSGHLFEALTHGDAKEANKWTQELVHAVDPDSSFCIPEKDWFDLLHVLREKKSDFHADYILKEEQIVFLSENSSVLPDDLKKMVSLALKHKAGILELPLEEEADYE